MSELRPHRRPLTHAPAARLPVHDKPFAAAAAGHPLRTAPWLLATPHLGHVSQNNYRTYYGQAVENIEAFLAGEPVRRLGRAMWW